MGVASYVYYNKAELLKTITDELNGDLNGKLTIEKMEPSLIRGFPGISVSLENVLLRDSLWLSHKHDLVNAKNVFISIDALSILTGSPRIKDIRIQNGSMYVYTDSNGIRNSDIFKKKAPVKKGEGGGTKKINRIYLDNVNVTVDDQQKDKLFKFAIDNFLGRINYNGEGWKGNIRLKAKVESFAFKLSRGSFIKNQVLDMDLDMSYSDLSHQLLIPEQEISIGKDELQLGGKFKFAENASDFELTIKAPSILYKNAAAFLPSQIGVKLKPYSIKEPIEVGVLIRGKLKQGGDPRVYASWKVENNALTSLGETITECSFTGEFTNEMVKGRPRKDPNSAISFYKMTGKYYDIPFTADSIRINDLRNPIFTGKFKSEFPLTKLNKVITGNTFFFNSGMADLSIDYKAPFNQNTSGQRFIYGTVHVHDATATYKPRNLALKNMQLIMNFKGNDLFLENIKVKSGETSLAMNGAIRNFSNLYYTAPEKILIDWQIKSPQVNLNEFMGFLGKRKSANYDLPADNDPIGKMSVQLNKMLDQASMNMNMSVDRLLYKNFIATQVRSDITLRKAGIFINNLSLNQGGGSLNIKGNIDQSGAINRFKVDTKISNVNVEKLFYAFDNFGQDAITAQNLRGTFFGSTSVSGSMKDNGQIVPRSFNGSVDFDIRNGSLVNFDPMTKVGAFAFPNRNFSNIRFSNLKNTLNIQGNKIYIPPMEIRSNVLNIFLDGVYSLTTGTNIAIKIPLRNPEKDALMSDKQLKKERELRGIVINVRALDGDDGKIRFRLGKKTPEGYE